MTWSEAGKGFADRRRNELIREMSPKARPGNSYWYRCINLGATPDYVYGADEGEAVPKGPKVELEGIEAEMENWDKLPAEIF